MDPRVSVVLTTYNRAHYLKEAIESVLAQTFQDFELLICDNASTDGTMELVASFKDPRILYVRNSINRGAGYNCVQGMRIARGEYISTFHDDDLMRPYMLERQVKAMESDPDVSLCCTNVSAMDDAGNPIEDEYPELRMDIVFSRGGYIFAYMDSRFTLHCSTFMARNTHEAQGIDEIGPSGDVYFACRMNTIGKIALLGERLMDYRIHQSQESVTLPTTDSDIILHDAILGLCSSGCFHELIPLVKWSRWRYLATRAILAGRDASSEIIALRGLEFHPSYSMPIPPDRRTSSLLGKRVAIFGSLFNAYLLALDCKLSGVDLICFIDSKPSRQVQTMCGLPIIPPEELRTTHVDAVIISCEKRPKEQVIPLIRQFTDAPIYHWKDMSSKQQA